MKFALVCKNISLKATTLIVVHRAMKAVAAKAFDGASPGLRSIRSNKVMG